MGWISAGELPHLILAGHIRQIPTATQRNDYEQTDSREANDVKSSELPTSQIRRTIQANNWKKFTRALPVY